MQSASKIKRNLRNIRRLLFLFMAALIVSGLTAMPVEKELSMAARFFDEQSFPGNWLNDVYSAVRNTNENYPWLFYGYDWLAFAHIVLAIFFIGPYRDPEKNRWVISAGAMACVLVIPLALIMGYVRGIPLSWRLVDCAFGMAGLIPLGICSHKINQIEQWRSEEQQVPDTA